MGLGSWLTKKVLSGVKSLTGLDIPNVEPDPQPKPKKPKKEKPVKRTLALVFLALAATLASAQAFTASSDAIGFLDKGKSVGTLLSETAPIHYFNAGKTSFLSVQGTEIINTTLGSTSYLAGGEYTPDLNTFLKKHTTLTSENFTIAVSAGVGNTTFSSTEANHLSWIAGGKLAYKASSTVAVKVIEAGYLSYGTTRAPYVSGGLAVFWK